MTRLLKHRLFWPIAALLALIVINTIARPQFISITVRDGQLYGALIDVLRNSAPLMLVALGMTIVIATRGIDLSVGAVMAVSGAVALTIIDNSGDPNNLGIVAVAVVTATLVGLVLGSWNGLLVARFGIQPIIATLVLMLAGRGVALLITGGFITTVNSEPFEYLATGYLLGLPFAFIISLAAIILISLFERRTALGMLTEAVGINPEASRLAGVRARGIIFSGLHAQRTPRGHRGHPLQLEHQGCRRERGGPVHRALRDPRGGPGRHVAAGRQVQHRWDCHRRADHPDPGLDDPVPRSSVGPEPGVLRAGGRAGRGRPVAQAAPSPAEADDGAGLRESADTPAKVEAGA